MGDNFLVNLWGSALHGGSRIRSSKGGGSFTNAFFSDLKTVSIKFFDNHELIYTLR